MIHSTFHQNSVWQYHNSHDGRTIILSARKMATTEEKIEETFVNVGHAETCLLKLGSLSSAPTSEDGKKMLFLIIPGNPGVPDYYKDFMQELYRLCNGQVPVWTVGQSGHVQPPSQKLSLSHVYSTCEDNYGLQGQIHHKVTFIKENVPNDVSIIFIGHSIGCYMILNMLEHLPSSRVLRCFMLFPTVERMAISPNGKKMTFILRYLRWLLVLAGFFLSIIPQRILRFLIGFHFKNSDCPQCFHDGVMRTVSPWTINMTTYLAKLEMNEVDDIQKDLIEKHSDKLSYYYGACDSWAPKEYFYDLKASFPDADARLCEKNYKHAFIQEATEGREMAEIVWSWSKLHHHLL